ncbi:FAD-dependent oxidoreductase [Pontibacter sp. G13]|uniref:flavin monoamine oxidase family protein n=1 Tax=Pontibacter sp. G13 TaxID=3074898 RepID=UPI00288A078A|nr:FAD-dependent oxidoreductase [Pontibacter sp. G13]WNJ18324.1 FAD-dependent oxidoreductase [Pontibacter sp. G13]
MTKREFLRLLGLMGVSIPTYPALLSCESPEEPTPFSGSVLIIGAGAAGMTAGYRLAQAGVPYQILEASSQHGGRMRTNTTFADFPIPLGAEWLHIEPGIFAEIVNDPSQPVEVALAAYEPQSQHAIWDGTELQYMAVGNDAPDQKFVDGTWLTFFEEFILPTVQSNIQFDTKVDRIEWGGDQVQVRDTGGETFSADRLILTIPLRMLQLGEITFEPELPDSKQEAIRESRVWDGIKVFLEFSEKFYPETFEYPIDPPKSGQMLYFDAAYGQDTSQHVLGLFAVGSGAMPYLSRSGDELKDYILAELDPMFGGKASETYLKHLVQNWNQQPLFQGAYLYDHEKWRRARDLGRSVEGKLFFAGEAYSDGNDWGSVHAAARAAIRAVEEMLE